MVGVTVVDVTWEDVILMGIAIVGVWLIWGTLLTA